MATAFCFEPTPTTTYATRENVIKAVEKLFTTIDHFGSADVHYVIMTTSDGRFYPLFIGERALQHSAHRKFCVTA